jgi:predicted NBD/HSP70 family sugar kinase
VAGQKAAETLEGAENHRDFSCWERRRSRKIDAARKSFERAAYFLGIGLGTAINLLNPRKILLGGGVMTSAELLLPQTRAEARRGSYRASFDCCSIEKASLGNDAGLMGAASWAKDQLRENRARQRKKRTGKKP